jgi:SAM-dependent methyltransferase
MDAAVTAPLGGAINHGESLNGVDCYAVRKTIHPSIESRRTDVVADGDVSLPPLHDWEEFARREPYFAILTEERFLSDKLDDDALREFFASGERDVEFLSRFANPHLRDVLDFGCGAGRLTLAWAKRADHVVGYDAAPTMIEIARKHAAGVSNVEYVTALGGEFDLICSLIVFQHIPVREGEAIFARLLSMLRPGGVAMIELAFTRPGGAIKRFARRLRASSPLVHRIAQIVTRDRRRLPYMQMNVYDRDRIVGLIRAAHCDEPRFVPTSHGGIDGAIVIAQKLSA